MSQTAQGLNQNSGLIPTGISQQAFQQPRLPRVWVACRLGDVLAVFPSKALADIYIAGADAAEKGAVTISEQTIWWGQ